MHLGIRTSGASTTASEAGEPEHGEGTGRGHDTTQELDLTGPGALYATRIPVADEEVVARDIERNGRDGTTTYSAERVGCTLSLQASVAYMAVFLRAQNELDEALAAN